MFCTKCGTKLPDGSLFCTECGTPVEGAAPEVESRGRHAQQAQAPRGPEVDRSYRQQGQAPRQTQAYQQAQVPRQAQAYQQAQPQQERSKRTVVVVSVVVIVVALCVIVAVFASGVGSSGKSGSSAAAGAGTSVAASQAQQASQGSAASAGTESAAQQAQTAPEPQQPAALVDLSQPTDYRDLNLFLSNFSEWTEFYLYGKNTIPFDRNNPNKEQLVNWSMWHNAINNDGTLVKESTKLSGAPASSASKGIDGISADTYLRHMDTQIIEDSIRRYTGLDMDLSGYNSGNGNYYERDGIMYEGSYRGSASPLDHVTLCDSVEDKGNSTVQVRFTIYSGNHSFEIVQDDSWYSMNGSELESAMRAAGSSNVVKRSGTATVEVIGSGSDRSFQLVTFSVS